jgi:hypothetical protein
MQAGSADVRFGEPIQVSWMAGMGAKQSGGFWPFAEGPLWSGDHEKLPFPRIGSADPFRVVSFVEIRPNPVSRARFRNCGYLSSGNPRGHH